MSENSNADDWEKIDVPRGAYIGWGSKPGQHVTGTVLNYDETGSTDFNGDQCPLLEIELTATAASFNKKGERSNHEAGEVVCLSCGQVSLKRAVKRAEPQKGWQVKITLDDIVEQKNGNTVKEFGIAVKRTKPAPSAEKSSDSGDFGEPPW